MKLLERIEELKNQISELESEKQLLLLEVARQELPFTPGDRIINKHSGEEMVFYGFTWDRWHWYPEAYRIKKNGEPYQNTTRLWSDDWGKA